MSENNDNIIKLSPEDFDAFQKALEAPACPTPKLLELSRRYQEKIASGELIVEDDSEEFAAWAKAQFSKTE